MMMMMMMMHLFLSQLVLDGQLFILLHDFSSNLQVLRECVARLILSLDPG